MVLEPLEGGFCWDALIGAFFLGDLDTRMAKSGLFYARFMDHILAVALTRSKPSEAVRAMNEVLAFLRLEKRPDKTFIGKIEKGFDFIGCRFGSRTRTGRGND